jgi:hypothetical protein
MGGDFLVCPEKRWIQKNDLFVTMGNKINKDQWAGRERLAFIERTAWWRGVVNRGDLREVFGISAAQASADLQGYQELNPAALAYNVRLKRYEARPEMVCVLHVPHLEEAVGMFLGAAVPMPTGRLEAEAKVDVFRPPVRKGSAGVEKRIFLALDQRRRLTVKYWSVNSSGKKRREIAPHALGYDGLRWHVRAWCFENEGFRDFVLSRIEEAEWPEVDFEAPMRDDAWEREVTLVLKANSALDDEQRKTIERDYGMKNGNLELRVREAMVGYCLAQLRIPETASDGKLMPQHLEICE